MRHKIIAVNWFLNEHLAETYTTYTTYYFDQAYFEDNFKEKNNSINQLLYSTTFEQQLLNFEYLNHQIHIWIAAHQSTVTLFETEEESYQTAPIFDLFLSESEHSTQTVTPKPIAQDSIAATANQYDDEYKFQIMPANAGENNTSFTTQFENKFRTPILISKWRMELEKRTQGPGEIVTEYAKAIRKLIKLRTNLSYALWPFLALKDNPTMNMAIELAQQIEDNQRIHLGSTLPVFAFALVMAPAPQMAAASFANLWHKWLEITNNYKDPNINHVLISPSNLLIKDNKIVVLLYIIDKLQQSSFISFTFKLVGVPPKGESTSQPEKNLFFAFNLTNNDHNIDELAINTSESTRKKKKAKVDFVLDLNKVLTSTANNNKPPKAKIFKNPPKLEPPEIVQKSGPYFVVKDLMETPAHITFGQLMIHPQFRKDLRKSLIPKKKTPKINKHLCQAGLADNSNVISLICKAQVAGYFIDLILDSGLSVSKKNLGIAKAIPVCINGISIETDMEVSEAKEYTIIKVKALLNYELCELTIRCGEKPIVVKCCHWTTPLATKQNQENKQLEESDDEESDEENEQKEQEETAELVYTTFTSNGKPLDNVKADKKGIIVNGKLICWLYYDILRRTFDQKPGKKAKYYYCLIPREELKEVQKSFENKPPEIQLLVVEERELSPEERKIDIENLLARNSPVISKEGDTPG
ncbi:hypothetical protein G9A89_017695 [Geosiphon pyriformis]|nr:hypothetical protein G9A89_017695 [Geosiphon pyriformis]